MIYLKLFITAVLWGGTFVAGRFVAQQVEPLSASFLRFFTASIFLVILAVKMDGCLPRLTRRQWVYVVLLGLTGVIAYNVFFFMGLQTIAASRASLIVASNPVLIALFSALLFRERIGLSGSVGIALCLFGALIVITRGHPLDVFAGRLGTGELYILGCVASWVSYSLIGKSVMKTLSPVAAVTYACLIGTVGLFVPACLEGMIPSLGGYAPAVWLGLFYLGFFGTAVGFIWYYEGIKAIGPARASVFINFVPASGVFFGWSLLGEAIDWSLLTGAVLVIGGVLLTNRRSPL